MSLTLFPVSAYNNDDTENTFFKVLDISIRIVCNVYYCIMYVNVCHDIDE